MRILLSNDDGYRAPGLLALASKLRTLADVLVVAPERNRSGASSSLTLDRPLRLTQIETDSYAVDGTPADCVHLALTQLCTPPPDLVIAGINAGENMGDDVLYSGTVAAALEGRMMGYPAFAVSLLEAHTHADYTLAAAITYDLVKRWQAAVEPKCWLLNINVPGATSPKGLLATRLGRRQRGGVSIAAQDPYGRPIFWVGPVGPPGLDAGPGTDFHAVANHYVSVTPLQPDMTAYSEIETVTSLVSAN